MVGHTMTTPATPQSRVVTGQYLGKSGLSKRQRAVLAALWLAGEIEVKPTAAMAAALFKVSTPYITQATAALREVKAAKKNGSNGNGRNGHGHNGNGNGNGNDYVVRDRLPFVPSIDDVWSHLSDDEREAFVADHADSIWSTFDNITA